MIVFNNLPQHIRAQDLRQLLESLGYQNAHISFNPRKRRRGYASLSLSSRGATEKAFVSLQPLVILLGSQVQVTTGKNLIFREFPGAHDWNHV